MERESDTSQIIVTEQKDRQEENVDIVYRKVRQKLVLMGISESPDRSSIFWIWLIRTAWHRIMLHVLSLRSSGIIVIHADAIVSLSAWMIFPYDRP
jgi:hypothetical protein